MNYGWQELRSWPINGDKTTPLLAADSLHLHLSGSAAWLRDELAYSQ